MLKCLAQQTCELLSRHTPNGWLWRGRHVKLVIGTIIVMPKVEDNQLHYPQLANQGAGAVFPLASLVGTFRCTQQPY